MRKFIQYAFLGLFIFLVLTNRPQLWMGLLLLGIGASFFLGRIYCGWICSINTLMEMITAFKKKHGIKDRKIPPALKNPLVRWGLLTLFFLTFVFVMRSGRQLPILPLIFLAAVSLTFFFHEELWHRFLCPYGSILSASASKSGKGMSIDQDSCINCGMCAKVCPGLAVEKNHTSHSISVKDCLVCMKCEAVCKPEAISYK